MADRSRALRVAELRRRRVRIVAAAGVAVGVLLAVAALIWF
jgi:hypothetical protein